MLAQLIAVAIGGCVLSLVGAGLTVAAVAVSLSDHRLRLPRLGRATWPESSLPPAFAGAAGAVLGAGIGSIVRNVGGAVTLTVFTFFVAPPLIVQLANDTASWMPATLASVISGVTDEVSQPAALAALAVWALIPALVGLVAVQRRDVV